MSMQGPKTESTELLFNSIAPTYDRLNHLLSLGIDHTWRRRSLRWIVNRSQPQQILDIACGTGDYSIAIARHAHPDTQVLGIDLTEGMLQVMRHKVDEQGLADRISCEQGNSEQMRFADDSFDRATIAFGIRNFEHREQALREILRVLRPGGRLVILELSLPANPLIRWCYNFYFTQVLPRIGGWLSLSARLRGQLPRTQRVDGHHAGLRLPPGAPQGLHPRHLPHVHRREITHQTKNLLTI